MAYTLNDLNRNENFSVPTIVFAMVMGSVSWFVAVTWTNVFQSAVDAYEASQRAKNQKISPIWNNFVAAVLSTFFAVLLIFISYQIYQMVIHNRALKNALTPHHSHRLSSSSSTKSLK